MATGMNDVHSKHVGAERNGGDLEVGITDTLQRHPTVHLISDHSVPVPQYILNWEARRPTLIRQMAAEATGVFCYAYCGGAAFATFFLTIAAKETYFSSLLTVGFGYALGIALGILVSGMTSGAQLNPAVTITFALLGRFPWKRVPAYVFAQCFGGFMAVIFIYGQYNQQFKQVQQLFALGGLPVVSATGPASVFVAIPVAGQNGGTLFATEFLADMFLGLIIFTVLDPSNAFVTPASAPIVIGLAYACMVWGFGINTLSTNMAKDFGGRCAAAIFFGKEVFTTPTLPGYAANGILTSIPATFLAALIQIHLFGNWTAALKSGHGIHPEVHQVLESERARRRDAGLPAEDTGAMVRRLTDKGNNSPVRNEKHL